MARAGLRSGLGFGFYLGGKGKGFGGQGEGRGRDYVLLLTPMGQDLTLRGRKANR